MAKPAIRVLITGAAGQIGYSLIPMVCRGDVFGTDQPLILHLLDIPPMATVLEGVQMEVQDCAFGLVRSCHAFTEEQGAFTDIDAAFLVGSMPRRQGQSRKDLLSANVKIFVSQGTALKKWARESVRVLVVGNPANTNALICAKYAAPRIPTEQISAMTHLDQNRATAKVAEINNLPVDEVQGVVIWGNHSQTQVVDINHVTHKGNALPSLEVEKQENLKALVRKRGEMIIERRKLSSAMSAAKAAADHMRNFYLGSKTSFFSAGVFTGPSGSSEENHRLAREYGASDELIFSLPINVDPVTRTWKVIPGLVLREQEKQEIVISNRELLEEREEALSATNSISNL